MHLRARLAVAAAVALGIAMGLGTYTFVYARGYSYLSNDPAACANCHAMREHFDAWNKSTHRAVATCNDCHTPHNLAGKYYVKGRNGFWHSFYFTMGRYPDQIGATPGNQRVTARACRECHAEITQAIDPGPAWLSVADTRAAHAPEATDCVRCHRYVGHYVR